MSYARVARPPARIWGSRRARLSSESQRPDTVLARCRILGDEHQIAPTTGELGLVGNEPGIAVWNWSLCDRLDARGIEVDQERAAKLVGNTVQSVCAITALEWPPEIFSVDCPQRRVLERTDRARYAS